MYHWIKSKYKTLAEDTYTYITGKPIPIIQYRNFLPEEVILELNDECESIDPTLWKTFSRKGSHMKELNKLEYAPAATKLVSYLHSSHFIKYLEKITSIDSLIPDPHLIGAGYSKSYNGDTLKVHTDFNWNEELKLHRALSLIIYLNPNWDIKWGGNLDFYHQTRNFIEYKADCGFNSALLWEYNKYGYHGYEDPISCPDNQSRNTFRLFYYISNATHIQDDPPHRSLYWYDEKTMQPYDKKEEK